MLSVTSNEPLVTVWNIFRRCARHELRALLDLFRSCQRRFFTLPWQSSPSRIWPLMLSSLLHGPPVSIFNAFHGDLRASHSQLVLFFHFHTNQLAGLLCIFRYSCSNPYSATQILPSSPEKLDRLKTWATGKGEASPFLWIYGLNSIQTCPVSFVETNEILLPWDKHILQMNCLSLPLNLSSATSYYNFLPSSSSTFNCLHPCIRR